MVQRRDRRTRGGAPARQTGRLLACDSRRAHRHRRERHRSPRHRAWRRFRHQHQAPRGCEGVGRQPTSAGERPAYRSPAERGVRSSTRREAVGSGDRPADRRDADPRHRRCTRHHGAGTSRRRRRPQLESACPLVAAPPRDRERGRGKATVPSRAQPGHLGRSLDPGCGSGGIRSAPDERRIRPSTPACVGNPDPAQSACCCCDRTIRLVALTLTSPISRRPHPAAAAPSTHARCDPGTPS